MMTRFAPHDTPIRSMIGFRTGCITGCIIGIGLGLLIYKCTYFTQTKITGRNYKYEKTSFGIKASSTVLGVSISLVAIPVLVYFSLALVERCYDGGSFSLSSGIKNFSYMHHPLIGQLASNPIVGPLIWGLNQPLFGLNSLWRN